MRDTTDEPANPVPSFAGIDGCRAGWVVVLAHLSQRCNTPEVAVAAVRPALDSRGFRGRLEVALQDQGLGPLELTTPQGELFPGSELSAPCPDPEEPGSSPGGAWAGRFAGG